MSEMNVFKRNDSCDGLIIRKKGTISPEALWAGIYRGKILGVKTLFFFKICDIFLEKRLPPASPRTPAGAFRISCGRGRARGPNLKNLAGAGAESQKSCGRGRARGPNLKNLAGAGGRGRPPARPQRPQRPQCGVFPTLL